MTTDRNLPRWPLLLIPVGAALLRVGWLLWRERAVVAFTNVTGDET